MNCRKAASNGWRGLALFLLLSGPGLPASAEPLTQSLSVIDSVNAGVRDKAGAARLDQSEARLARLGAQLLQVSPGSVEHTALSEEYRLATMEHKDALAAYRP